LRVRATLTSRATTTDVSLRAARRRPALGGQAGASPGKTSAPPPPATPGLRFSSFFRLGFDCGRNGNRRRPVQWSVDSHGWRCDSRHTSGTSRPHHSGEGLPMDRPTHLGMAAPVTLVVLALSLSSFAADKASTTFVANPACGICTFDSITKGSLTMSSTTAPGANGVKFKFSLSGATSGGLPVNGAQFVLALQLSFNGGPCDSFASPVFEMVNGKAKAIFDGSSLTPQP